MNNLFTYFTDFIGWFFLFGVATIVLFTLIAIFLLVLRTIYRWFRG